MTRPRLRAVNTTRHVLLAKDMQRAASPWTRALGLLGRAALVPGEGLHILPCCSVHTWFMRFPIDVLYLDRACRVVKAVTDLRPFRCSWGGRRAHSVLELPAGTIAATGTTVDDQLTLDVASIANV